MTDVGYATLQIIPSLRGVEAEINKQLGGKLATAGSKAGSQFGSGFATGAGKAVSAGFTLGVAGAGALAVATLKAGASYNVLEQSAGAAFKTLLGSQAQATAFIDQLKEFGKSSPFPRQVFIEGAQQLLAFGQSANKIIPELDAIQNAVAAAGGSSQQLKEVTFVLAQISAAGKITGQDLIQLGQRGINAAEIIGSQMGKTGAQIRAEITAGTLDATKAVDALVAGMAQKFDGAAAGLKNTFVGAADRVRGALRDIGSELLTPFVNGAGGGGAVDWANTLATTLRGIESGVLPKLAPQIEHVADSIGHVVDGLAGLVTPEGVLVLVDDLGKIAPVAGAAVSALAAFSASKLPFGLGGILNINPVLAGLAGLVAATPEARAALAGVAAEVAPLVSELTTDLVPILADLSDLAGQVLPPAIGLAGDALRGVLSAAIAVAPVIEGLTGVLADNRTVTYALIGAYVGLKATAGAAAALTALSAGATGLVAGANAAAVAIATLTAASGSASAAMVGLAFSSVSASASMAGIGAGVAVGAGLAINSLAKSAHHGAEAADEFYASLQIDESDKASILAGMNAINAQILVLQAVAEKGSGFDRFLQRLNPFDKNTTDEAVGQIDELDQKSELLAAVYDSLSKAGTGAAMGTRELAGGIDLVGTSAAQAVGPVLDLIKGQLELAGTSASAKSAFADLATAQETAAGRGKVIADIQSAAAKQHLSDIRSVQQAEQSAADSIAAAQKKEQDSIVAVSSAKVQVVVDTAKSIAAHHDEESALLDVAKAYDTAEESLAKMKRTAAGDKLSVELANFRVEELQTQLTNDGGFDTADPNAQRKLEIELAQAISARDEAVQQAQDSTESYNTAVQQGVDKSPEVLSALDAYNTAQATAATAEQTRIDSIGKVTEAEDAQRQAANDLARAEIDGNQQISDAKATMAENAQKASLDVQTAIDDATNKLPELTLAAQTAAIEYAKAWADAGAPVDVINTGLDTLTTKLTPGSPTWEAIQQLKFLLGLASLPVVAEGTLQNFHIPGSNDVVQRKGGINLAAFADGGVAGITPAMIHKGTLIKAFEPETGGEAYIPRLGDRARGRSILATAASWYGLDIIPAGARPMAAGGILASGSSGAVDPLHVVLDQLTGSVKDLAKAATSLTKATERPSQAQPSPSGLLAWDERRPARQTQSTYFGFKQGGDAGYLMSMGAQYAASVKTAADSIKAYEDSKKTKAQLAQDQLTATTPLVPRRPLANDILPVGSSTLRKDLPVEKTPADVVRVLAEQAKKDTAKLVPDIRKGQQPNVLEAITASIVAHPIEGPFFEMMKGQTQALFDFMAKQASKAADGPDSIVPKPKAVVSDPIKLGDRTPTGGSDRPVFTGAVTILAKGATAKEVMDEIGYQAMATLR